MLFYSAQPPPSNSGSTAPNSGSTAPTSVGTGTTGTTAPTQGSQGSAVSPAMFQDLLSQMQGGGVQGGGAGGGVTPQLVNNQLQQAEVLYQSQLEQLQNMGFPNRQANLSGKYASSTPSHGTWSNVSCIVLPSSGRNWR